MKRRIFLLLTLALLASFVLAACGGAAEPTAAPAAAPAAEEPTMAAEEPTMAAEEPTMAAEEPTEEAMAEEPMEDHGDMTSVGASAEGAASVGLTCLADAYNGQMQGTVVSMTGPFTDEDQVKFESSVKPFEDATGIDIQYEGSKEFEASIGVRMEAGDAPD
ncbi:MAG: carbohydrate ABC transporter substrate-binding protein, partial [Anaerolineae bacterium]|nr:carbohydrate ABC transporter substrate-binding protein [Anaerolineae bacterium]